MLSIKKVFFFFLIGILLSCPSFFPSVMAQEYNTDLSFSFDPPSPPPEPPSTQTNNTNIDTSFVYSSYSDYSAYSPTNYATPQYSSPIYSYNTPTYTTPTIQPSDYNIDTSSVYSSYSDYSAYSPDSSITTAPQYISPISSYNTPTYTTPTIQPSNTNIDTSFVYSSIPTSSPDFLVNNLDQGVSVQPWATHGGADYEQAMTVGTAPAIVPDQPLNGQFTGDAYIPGQNDFTQWGTGALPVQQPQITQLTPAPGSNNWYVPQQETATAFADYPVNNVDQGVSVQPWATHGGPAYEQAMTEGMAPAIVPNTAAADQIFSSSGVPLDTVSFVPTAASSMASSTTSVTNFPGMTDVISDGAGPAVSNGKTAKDFIDELDKTNPENANALRYFAEQNGALNKPAEEFVKIARKDEYMGGLMGGIDGLPYLEDGQTGKVTKEGKVVVAIPLDSKDAAGASRSKKATPEEIALARSKSWTVPQEEQVRQAAPAKVSPAPTIPDQKLNPTYHLPENIEKLADQMNNNFRKQIAVLEKKAEGYSGSGKTDLEKSIRNAKDWLENYFSPAATDYYDIENKINGSRGWREADAEHYMGKFEQNLDKANKILGTSSSSPSALSAPAQNPGATITSRTVIYNNTDTTPVPAASSQDTTVRFPITPYTEGRTLEDYNKSPLRIDYGDGLKPAESPSQEPSINPTDKTSSPPPFSAPVDDIGKALENSGPLTPEGRQEMQKLYKLLEETNKPPRPTDSRYFPGGPDMGLENAPESSNVGPNVAPPPPSAPAVVQDIWPSRSEIEFNNARQNYPGWQQEAIPAPAAPGGVQIGSFEIKGGGILGSRAEAPSAAPDQAPAVSALPNEIIVTAGQMADNINNREADYDPGWAKQQAAELRYNAGDTSNPVILGALDNLDIAVESIQPTNPLPTDLPAPQDVLAPPPLPPPAAPVTPPSAPVVPTSQPQGTNVKVENNNAVIQGIVVTTETKDYEPLPFRLDFSDRAMRVEPQSAKGMPLTPVFGNGGFANSPVPWETRIKNARETLRELNK